MKSYTIFAVTLFVLVCGLAWYNIMALVQFTVVCAFLVSLFLMGKMLRWVMRTLAK